MAHLVTMHKKTPKMGGHDAKSDTKEKNILYI